MAAKKEEKGKKKRTKPQPEEIVSEEPKQLTFFETLIRHPWWIIGGILALACALLNFISLFRR